MPALSNITVKKADGTTDIIYTGLVGAAGDGSAAVYRQEDLTVPFGHRPTLSIKSAWNGPKTARKVEATYKYPFVYTDSTTGLKTSKDSVPMYISGVFPAAVPDSVIAEAVAQCFNLFGTGANNVRNQFTTGFAAT